MVTTVGSRGACPAHIADDADALRLCSHCVFASACNRYGYQKTDLRALDFIVEHTGPYTPGSHIFREGDAFKAIAGVRAGTVKTYVVDANGSEQVLGFHLPGELIGLNAISDARYPCNAVALDDVSLCRLSFPAMSTLSRRIPDLQRHLFSLMSEEIRKASQYAGDYTAEERMAAFLVTMSERYAGGAAPANRFQLTMTRTDIASYLRLAPETISRLFKRFQNEGLLQVSRREICIVERTRLAAIAANVLRD